MHKTENLPVADQSGEVCADTVQQSDRRIVCRQVTRGGVVRKVSRHRVVNECADFISTACHGEVLDRSDPEMTARHPR